MQAQRFTRMTLLRQIAVMIRELSVPSITDVARLFRGRGLFGDFGKDDIKFRGQHRKIGFGS